MIDRLRREIIQFLMQHQVAHLAVSGPDGPWAAVVRFMSAGLTLYLIEPRASDLVFYLEGNPMVVLTVGDHATDPQGSGEESVQIFGSAQVLSPHEHFQRPTDVRTAYSFRNQQAPGVYVVIEVNPGRIQRIRRINGAIHRDTVDIEPRHDTPVG